MKTVSLAPSNTEIIYRLDLERHLVATTGLCNHPEEARKKKSVGGWTSGIDFQRIRNIDPDLILTSDSLQEPIKKELEGLEVLHVAPQTVEEIYSSIEKIGRRFDAEKKANSLVKEMKEGLSGIDVSGAPRIYCEEWNNPVMASGNWIPGLVERIGGKYFLEEGERSREFELEKLKGFDPEYIFINVCGAGKNVDTEKVLSRPGWQDITAVENGDVYVIDDALLNRPGPRLVEGAEEMMGKIS
ncbi:MAG: cobalamin-binding protein [Candidatus Nanohalobium sp.]